ncbi:MAG: hypothetical protein QOH36_652 [Actinomycetota bacterium]|nr:hypothetical protein [Actinomycetota bacterium]
MLWRRAADAVALSHLTLIGFILGGGFVARRHPRATKAHVVVLVGTAAVYAGGFDCPLTDWEKGLRRLAGDDVYRGGYLEHYLVSPWHPTGMSPAIGLGILGVAVATTALAYGGRVRVRASRPAR